MKGDKFRPTIINGECDDFCNPETNLIKVLSYREKIFQKIDFILIEDEFIWKYSYLINIKFHQEYINKLERKDFEELVQNTKIFTETIKEINK